MAVWDACLHYKVVIYSLAGRLCGSYTAYENALGIKSVQWSPSSQLLSIGSYDQAVRLGTAEEDAAARDAGSAQSSAALTPGPPSQVRLLNNLTWQKIIHFKHATAVPPAPTRVRSRQRRCLAAVLVIAAHGVLLLAAQNLVPVRVRSSSGRLNRAQARRWQHPAAKRHRANARCPRQTGLPWLPGAACHGPVV